MINKNTSNSNGFSFVELMVVIALIGLLSAIGLPSLLRSLPEKRLQNAA
ncbi:MAG: prepilin-type N-terminal cleavage/methylation domain-containing protein, partial [Candidatus Electrothrix sp. AW2]|nr:prepilin-type N-terminal cleavage/methylation domain-containing protein [Candidatus Electrothrix gigas]